MIRKCIADSFKMLILAVCLIFSPVTAEVFFSSPKNPSERVTSFAVNGNQLIFTYLGIEKEIGPHGIIKTYVIGSGRDPEKMYFPANSQPLVSPIAVEIDECDRLWILDNGVKNISGIQDKSHSPVLQAIGLKRNETIAKYYFGHTFRNTESFFTTLAIDAEKNCKETWVYVADFNSAKLLAYNMQKNSSWQFKHHYFNPEPTSYVPLPLIYNQRQKTMSAIYGLAVAGSYLYFHPFASKYEFRVDKHLLRQQKPLLYGSVSLVGNRGSEAGIMRFDKTNSVYFYAGFQGIGCWSNFENFTDIDVGLRDGFITDIQIVGPKLWILINSRNEYIFEIRLIEDLISNTSCKLHHRILSKGSRYAGSGVWVTILLFIGIIVNYNLRNNT